MVGRTPPVGAHYGLGDWLVQRATAAVLVVGIIVVFIAWWREMPQDYAAWRDFITAGWMRGLLMLMVLAVLWHAYIGARDIMMDYIKNDYFRLLKIISAVVYLLGCLIWAADILLI